MYRLALTFTLLVSALSANPVLLGTWQLSSQDGDGNTIKSEITFREEAGDLKAILKAKDTKIDVTRIKSTDDGVLFEIPWGDAFVAIQLAPKGDSQIAGKWMADDQSGPITGVKSDPWTGLWKLAASRPNGGTTRLELDLKPGGKFALRTANGDDIPVEQFALSGTDLSFNIAAPQGTFKVSLKLEGDGLKGTWSSADAGSGSVEGRR